MPIRDRILAMDYPYNIAHEIVMNVNVPDSIFPTDLEGSIEYILHTALIEKQRKILVMHWKDRLTLVQIGEKLNLSKQTVQSIEHKALRILRNPKWMRFVTKGVIGVIEHERCLTEEITKMRIENGNKSNPYEIPLHELEFSVRLFNALRRVNVETCGDIVHKMEENCCDKIRNLGKKSIIEILDKFNELGIEINNMPEVFEKWSITLQDLHD